MERLSEGTRRAAPSGEARLGEDEDDGRPRVCSAGNARLGWNFVEGERDRDDGVGGGARDAGLAGKSTSDAG